MKGFVVFILLIGVVAIPACRPTAPAPSMAAAMDATSASPTSSPTLPPATETPKTEERTPTSLEEIAGIWDSRMLSERGYQQFKLDGTMLLGYTIDQLRTNPVFNETVRVWFEGETFHVEDSCGHGTYRLTLTTEAGENRKLVFEVIEDPCEQRTADWKVPMRWFGAE